MSTKKLLQAASGAASGESVYVDDVFSTYLYTGNNADTNIVNGVNLADEGGLVWIKSRQAAEGHRLIDSEWSLSANKYIDSSSTTAPFSGPVVNTFNTDGFQLDSNWYGNSSDTQYGGNFASWTFRKQAGFFDVVTYTGTGTGTGERTINHNLGSTPGVIILKDTSAAGDWIVYHRDGTNSGNYKKNLVLNNANEESGNNFWVNAGITATTFRFNDQFINMNVSGRTYVAYLFAHDDQSFGDNSDEAIIKCGSLTIASQATAEVDCGFETQFVLLKNSTSSGNWFLFDTMRGMAVTGFNWVFPNLSGAEEAKTYQAVYPTATGFGFNPVNNGQLADGNYIYIAIRRPMKTPESGTEVFAVDTYNQTSASDPAFNLGGVVDFGLRRTTTESNWTAQARLTGDKGLVTNATDAESTKNYGFWDNMVGWHQGASITPPYSQSNSYGWSFKRASGFMDVVAYSGDGSATQDITHNLGASPDMIIVKQRTSSGTQWVQWNSETPNFSTYLNNNIANFQTGGGQPYYVGQSVSSTTFRVSTDGSANQSNGSGNNYIAYLFATLAGVSKVGSYTGTGSDINVDCGFTSGARFILIKRTDSTGDWYVWDSERGIVAGNDPYLLLNTTAAEVTSTDYIDPLSSGFTVTSSAPAALNTSSGEYIFLAIA